MMEYLDYAIFKIESSNPPMKNELIDRFKEFKTLEPSKYIIEQIRPIHHHFCKNLNIIFLDYGTYHRNKEYNIDIK